MTEMYNPIEPDNTPDNNSDRVKNMMSPYRQRIDDLDDAIMELFVQRFGVIAEVADFKKKNNIPVTIPERVDEVINRNVQKASEKGLPADTIRQVYTQIVQASCDLENQKIGVDKG